MVLLPYPNLSLRVATILASLLVAVAENRVAAEEPDPRDDFTLTGHDSRLQVVTFSADGSLLATVQTWGSGKLMGLKVWDLAARKWLYHLPYKEARRAAFTAAGDLVTAGPSDETVPFNLRESRTGKIIRALPELTRHVKPEEFIAVK